MVSADDFLNAKILIVDDQKSNIQLLEQLLSKTGYRHLSTTTDPYAVRTLHRDNRYDLIVLDLQMPGMDGFQVMEGLQNIETHDYVPILVLTAQPNHKLRALASGAIDFLAKPFDLNEVKSRIHNMLAVRLRYQQLQNYNQVLQQKVQERTSELRTSVARFHNFTELASDWYWEQDEYGDFTQAFGPVLEMFGVRPESLDGITEKTQVACWNEVERAAIEAKIVARQPFLELVYSRINVDATHQYFQVSGEPMFDASERFSGYRGVVREFNNV